MTSRCLQFWIVLVAVTCKAANAVDPFELPPVAAAMDRYEDSREKARKLLLNSLQSELKALTKRGDFAAATELQSLVAHLEQGNDPETFVAGGAGLAQPVAGARWDALAANTGVESITIYPNVPRGLPAQAILKQHVEGKLAKGGGGTVVKRDDRGRYSVPPQTGASYFAICAVRTKAPTALTVKASGNDNWNVTKNVAAFVNGANVPDGGAVMLPKGTSLILLKIQTSDRAMAPDEYWFRCDLFADNAEVHIPAVK